MAILIPKYKGFTDPKRPINAGKMGISGEARVVLYDENMNVKYDSGYFPNSIVDNGLDIIGNGAQRLDYRFYTGSGSTATTDGMTSMETFLAQSSTAISTGDFGFGSAPDYEFYNNHAKRFGAGVGTGTVREIGMGQSDDNSGTNIFNRVVLGTPVPKAANQVLDVFFRLTIWPPVTVVLAGTSTIAGVSYDTLTLGRDYPNWGGSGDPVFANFFFNASTAAYAAWTGDIGLVTQDPSGSSDDLSGGTFSSVPYVPGQYSRTLLCEAGLDSWTVSGGLIRSLTGAAEQFEWQTQFNATAGGAAIPKDGTEIMDFSWIVSWGRHTP